MSPLERLIGPLPTASDAREWEDRVGEAVVAAAHRDRERFLATLTHEPSLLDHHAVVFALGTIDDARLVELLASRALDGPTADARRCAALALACQRGNARVVDVLIAALRDRAVKVRAVAVEALGELGDRRALAPLQQALEHRSNRDHAWLTGLIRVAIDKLA